MGGASIKGLDQVVANLNAAIKQIEGTTLKGLLRGAIEIRRAMDKISPLIPVDTGNMRNSFFVVTFKGDVDQGASPTFVARPDIKNLATRLTSEHSSTLAEAKSEISNRPVMVMLGFSAFYTACVHEMIGANFKRPDAGAKFFQAAFTNTAVRVLELIYQEAKIK